MKYQLEKDEKEILDSFEKGQLKKASNMAKQIKKYQESAKVTDRKNKRINIRISQKDLYLIQRRALVEGMPYQTLISSLIHRYSSDKLIDKEKVLAR